MLVQSVGMQAVVAWCAYMLESRAKVVASAGDVCSEWLAHCPLRIFTNRCGIEEHLEKTLCSMMESELSSRSFAVL